MPQRNESAACPHITKVFDVTKNLLYNKPAFEILCETPYDKLHVSHDSYHEYMPPTIIKSLHKIACTACLSNVMQRTIAC